MTNHPKNGQAKIIRATKDLQLKAGSGEIEARRIKRAEEVIESNTHDFVPTAQEFLERLENGINAARKGNSAEIDLIAGMTRPVMELKANAQMFKYDLVSILANVMLGFLEHIQSLDKDAIDIVEAHHKTLSLIIHKRMKGDNGSNGALLKMELEDAVQRYFIKLARKKAEA
jgi:hypothetical protein